MRALCWIVTGVICLTWCAASAIAQTPEQDALLERLRDAEAEASTARQLLDEAKAEGEPLLQQLADLRQERQSLSDTYHNAMDRVSRAQDRVSDLPVHLTAKRDALSDILVRMYQRNADPDLIREKEHELEEVKAQIVRLQGGRDTSQARADQAYEAAQGLYRRLQALDRRIRDLSLEAASAEGRINGSERRYSRAMEVNTIRNF